MKKISKKFRIPLFLKRKNLTMQNSIIFQQIYFMLRDLKNCKRKDGIQNKYLGKNFVNTIDVRYIYFYIKNNHRYSNHFYSIYFIAVILSSDVIFIWKL